MKKVAIISIILLGFSLTALAWSVDGGLPPLNKNSDEQLKKGYLITETMISDLTNLLSGSGALVGADGYVLPNRFVVDGRFSFSGGTPSYNKVLMMDGNTPAVWSSLEDVVSGSINITNHPVWNYQYDTVSLKTDIQRLQGGSEVSASDQSLVFGKLNTGVAASVVFGEGNYSHNSLSFGKSNRSESYSVVFGEGARATALNSIAFGSSTSSRESIALGKNNTTSFMYGLASGSNNQVGELSVAIGQDSIAQNKSISFGSDNRVQSIGIAIGRGNQVNNIYGVALGSNNRASSYSVSFGESTTTRFMHGASFGVSTSAGEASLAFGASTTADGGAVSWGSGSQADAQSLVWGVGNKAVGNNSFALGYESDTQSNYSASFGNNNSYLGGYSFAFGNSNQIGQGIGFGENNVINGNSLSFGEENSVDNQSLAFGLNNNVSSSSIAMGGFNIANNQSIALGSNNQARGMSSLVLGSNNIASATSFIAGINNIDKYNQAAISSLVFGVDNSGAGHIFGSNHYPIYGSMVFGYRHLSRSSDSIIFGKDNDIQLNCHLCLIHGEDSVIQTNAISMIFGLSIWNHFSNCSFTIGRGDINTGPSRERGVPPTSYSWMLENQVPHSFMVGFSSQPTFLAHHISSNDRGVKNENRVIINPRSGDNDDEDNDKWLLWVRGDMVADSFAFDSWGSMAFSEQEAEMISGESVLQNGVAEIEISGDDIIVQLTAQDECEGLYFEKTANRIIVKELNNGSSNARFYYNFYVLE